MWGRPPSEARLRFSEGYAILTTHSPVILSEVADSRRESVTQSKDPYPVNGTLDSKGSLHKVREPPKACVRLKIAV
jgi:hypothetical protein